ncbi:endonuclease/exonuclease/phosphatase family protein [Saccharopolyspora sp. NPDC003752]
MRVLVALLGMVLASALLTGSAWSERDGQLEPAAGSVGQPAVRATGSTLKVLQWNIDGEKDNNGSDQPIDRLVEKIEEFDPDIVTANEVCKIQYEHLLEKLNARGIEMHGNFGQASSPLLFSCGDWDTDYVAGNVVLTKAPIRDATNYWFEGTELADGKTNRGFSCVTAEFATVMRACSVHLAPQDSEGNVDEAVGQAATIADLVGQFTDEYPYVIGGDFNAVPDKHLDSMYAPDAGGNGEFYEAAWQQDGHGFQTHPQGKLDYIFADSKNFLPDMTARSLYGEKCEGSAIRHCSDHRLLYGEVTLRAQDVPNPNVPPVDDAPPVVDAGQSASGDEGAPVKLNGSATDDRGTPAVHWSYQPAEGVDAGTECEFGSPDKTSTSFSCNDDGRFTVTLTADDGRNPPVSDSTVVDLRNVAPKLTSQDPEPWSVFRVGTDVPFGASFTDPGENDTHTCSYEWDDPDAPEASGTSDSCEQGHAFSHAGMYTVRATVTDDDGGSDTTSMLVVVYDPTAGLLASAGTTGDETFVASAKYPAEDSAKPLGTYVLRAGSTQLVTTSFDWLVITPDGKAALRGTGTVDGTEHGFLVYVTAGHFRTVTWPLSESENPPADPEHDSNPGASYDVDEADPIPVPTGVTVIDTGWLPGLPAPAGELLEQLPGAAEELEDLLPPLGR